jgi:hypothetical protein
VLLENHGVLGGGDADGLVVAGAGEPWEDWDAGECVFCGEVRCGAAVGFGGGEGARVLWQWIRVCGVEFSGRGRGIGEGEGGRGEEGEGEGRGEGGGGGCAVVQGVCADAGEAEVLVADFGVRAVPDAAERDVDVRGDGVQLARLLRGLRVLHLPVPHPHRVAAQLVPARVLLRGLLGRGAQQPLAALPALPRRDGHAAGDHRAGHRHRERLGAAGPLLGQIRRSLLAGHLVRVPLHRDRLHPVCAERHVRRRPLPVRRILYANSLRVMLSRSRIKSM